MTKWRFAFASIPRYSIRSFSLSKRFVIPAFRASRDETNRWMPPKKLGYTPLPYGHSGFTDLCLTWWNAVNVVATNHDNVTSPQII